MLMAVPLRLRLIASLKFEKPLYAVAAGDFDGDGKVEIATGSGDGNLRIHKFERGKLISIWNTRFLSWVDQIVVADINDDTIDEDYIERLVTSLPYWDEFKARLLD